MLSKVLSASLLGIDARAVEVEVDVGRRGIPHFSVVGLPDAAVKESRDRVRSALRNVGLGFPLRPITVNLAPADLKKEGSAFDLPIAVGLIASEGVVPAGALSGRMFVGELSLDGRVKPVRGALSVGILARELGRELILPMENAAEAAVPEGVVAYGARTLSEVVSFLRGEAALEPARPERALPEEALEDDFSDVKGQEHAKRALEVAAAGGHNVLMIGPPGSGKTMLARRLRTIMPPISLEEAIETSRIWSVAGMLRDGRPVLGERPFRAPHHTISDVALVGGGQTPRPGEASLAHNGVLFLDELPEFKRSALEVLRQPLEDREITVSRAAATIAYPARFMLVAALNPCPCGFFGDGHRPCTCTAGQIQRYRARLSGPLLDRIDIHIEVPSVPYKEIAASGDAEGSAPVRLRVMRAREIQADRFRSDKIYTNAQMSPRHLKKHCSFKPEARDLMEAAMRRLGLSARAYARIQKLSRTIADLEGAESIEVHHTAEAIQYRSLDRQAFSASH